MLARVWNSVATSLGGALIILVVLNVLAVPFVAEHPLEADARADIDRFVQRYGWEPLRSAYPGKSDAEIKRLLIDTSTSKNRYYPFVEFINAQSVSERVFVAPEGFRSVGDAQAQWPPPPDGFNIFLFGSSTLLGLGVSNEETIGARLQSRLRSAYEGPINVYNFGTGGHYSTQEVLFLMDFLRRGIKPNLAVFLDGLNDFYFYDDRTALSGYIEASYEKLLRGLKGLPDSAGTSLASLIGKLPLIALYRQLRASAVDTSHTIETTQPSPPLPGSISAEEKNRAEQVIARYLRTVTMTTALSASQGTQTLFIWQPTPFFDYDLPRYGPVHPRHLLHPFGYAMIEKRLHRNDQPANFSSCASAMKGATQSAYIEGLHYSAYGSRLVAACMADRIAAAEVIPFPATHH